MKKIFWLLLMFSANPSLAGPGPSATTQNCQEIYNKLDTMPTCTPSEMDLVDGCVEAKFTVNFVEPIGGDPFCNYQLIVLALDIPKGINEKSDLKVKKETGPIKLILIEGELMELENGQPYLAYEWSRTAGNEHDEFNAFKDEYKYFLLHEDDDLDYGVAISDILCHDDEACIEVNTDLFPPDQTTQPGDNTNKPATTGQGTAGDGTGQLSSGTGTTGSDQTQDATQGDDPGTHLSSCMNLGSYTSYNFGFGWFALLGMLLAALRRQK